MVYFDNAATTQTCAAAADAVADVLINHYGNPSSGHFYGMEAEKILENSRSVIAKRLGADRSEIYFTSGGTEANNIAVFGAVGAAKKFRNKKRIITTAIEHSSVFELMIELQNSGYDVAFLKPDKHGNITASQIAEAVDENTVLVSVMLTNNELGSVLPAEEIKRIVKLKNSPALIHCDCIQAFCKQDFTVKSLGADLVSVSAHKIFGPKGTGALYVRKGVRIKPLIRGGEQEKKIRPGTQASALIAGFAVATEEYDTFKSYKIVSELNAYIKDKLRKFDGIVFNSGEDAVPYILNFSIPGFRSETVLNYLSERKICVSSGSACAKGRASHVLEAAAESKHIADSALRLSFSPLNTKAEADEFIAALDGAVKTLAGIKL